MEFIFIGSLVANTNLRKNLREKSSKNGCFYKGIYISRQLGGKHQAEGKRKNYKFLGLC